MSRVGDPLKSLQTITVCNQDNHNHNQDTHTPHRPRVTHREFLLAGRQIHLLPCEGNTKHSEARLSARHERRCRRIGACQHLPCRSHLRSHARQR